MQKTKLISLLRTFSKSQIIRFGDFINSHYFNKNQNVIFLTRVILSRYPAFDEKNFTEEYVFSEAFDGQVFDYFKLKNVISDIYQLAILFLKTELSLKKETENEIALLNELHERKLNNLYNQREKKLSAFLNSTQVKDENYYFLRHHLGKINTTHYKFNKTGYTFNQIQNEFDTFFDYTLTGLLRLYSKMLHNRNHGNIKFNMEMFENVWEYIKDKKFEDNPSCQIYRQIISLELSRSEEDYRKLLNLKEKYHDNMPAEDIYYILLIINSYAAYRLNLGDESYYKERHLAFKEIIERDFFRGEILYPNFITTFTSACVAGEIEWAENFRKTYMSGIVPPEEKLNALNYCNGFLAYTQNQYEKALEYFARTSFKLYLFKVMVKSYTARIYYEQNMTEQTLSAADSFRHYLKAEKLVAENQKKAHYEFIKYLVKLSQLKAYGTNMKNSADAALLKKQIKQMSSNPLGSKNWLLMKIDELK